MKITLIIAFIICLSMLSATMPAEWADFQKDIGIQAAQYQNSPEHQQIRNSRDTRNYNVGDTETFWRWNLAVMPPTWIQTAATCRAVGEHCYVFVADDQWNTHMTQANVDSVLVRLEDNTPNNPDLGAIEMDEFLFGPVPDELDNDPKLIVFYSALGSFQGSYFDGYFSAYNQVTEAQAQQMNPPGHSNECEMIYMTCYPLSPVAPIRLSVLSHELEHLIHWGQDANEESWLDEGCAELAMVAYGVPDPISSFPNNPDNSLNVWNQQTADYVKVMLFFTYLKEHYDETGMIRDLVANPINGMSSLQSEVGQHYPELTTGEIIRNWSVANILDSTVPDSLYNYEELDLPNFSMTNVNTYPSGNNLTVQPYASDFLYYDLSWRPVTFFISADGLLYATELVFNADNECTAVNQGDYSNIYTFNIPGNAESVVYVVTNTSPGSVTYSYSAGVVANDDNISTEVQTAITGCYPNPFSASAKISFNLKEAGHAILNIYNIKGQLVKSLVNENKISGQHEITWTGDSDSKTIMSSGVYIVRLQSGGETRTSKILYRKISE